MNTESIPPEHEVLPDDGIHRVVLRAGSTFPYWVEVRTYRNAPVFGRDKDVRGCTTLYQAKRLMKAATRSALALDPSLKRFYKATLPAASRTLANTEKRGRGRPAGSKTKKPQARKPGPVPKAKVLQNRTVFYSTRFVISQHGTNPVAQVWRCVDTTANPRRRDKKGMRITGVYPHTPDQYAVVLNDEFMATDEEGTPLIFTLEQATREAEFYYALDESPNKLPRDGSLHYRNAEIEVIFCPDDRTNWRPYYLLSKRTRDYCLNGDGDPMRYDRLSSAIKHADTFAPHMNDRLVSVLTTISDAMRDDPEEDARRAAMIEAEDRAAAAWLREDEEHRRKAAAHRPAFISRDEYVRRMKLKDPDFGKTRRAVKDLAELLELTPESRPRIALHDQRGAEDEHDLG